MVEPFPPASPTFGGEGLDLASLEPAPLPEEPRDVAPEEALPGDKRLRIDLTLEQEEELVKQLDDLIDAHNAAIAPRAKRWGYIDNAYFLIPDVSRAGIGPNASNLVSEITRVHVNNATARIVGAMMDVAPLVSVSIAGQESSDEDTKERLKEADSTEKFFESYKRDMDLERVIPDDIARATRLSTSITRISWEVEPHVTRFVDKNGDIQSDQEDVGVIRWTLIPNENFVLWPHTTTDIQRAELAGHKACWVPSKFERWAKNVLELDQATIDEVLGRDSANDTDQVQVDKAKRRDIDLSGGNPFKGEVETYELWLNFPLHQNDDSPDPRYQVIYHRNTRRLLYVGENPFHCRLHPYWDTTYLRDDEGFWGTGVGDELVFHQAAASAGLNMLVDNFKIVSNNIRLIKSGSPMEANIGNIEPGKDYSVEHVNGDEADFAVVALGQPLDGIYQFLSDNEMRGTRSTGLAPTLLGYGDPTMKSGATASAVQTLVSEAQRKFGFVDRNVRESYSRKYMFVLHLLQQYAPQGLWYEVLAQEDAERASRIKYRPPSGRLDRIFRIEVQAPSAATNKEGQKQAVQQIYQQAQAHVQMVIALASDAIGQFNPAGLQRLKEESLQLLNELFKRILQLHDIPGVALPETGPPTPPEQMLNQLYQQLQQMQQQAQQLAMQNQQLKQQNQMAQQQLQMVQQQQPPGMPPMGRTM